MNERKVNKGFNRKEVISVNSSLLLGNEAFHCPHIECQVFAQQEWYHLDENFGATFLGEGPQLESSSPYDDRIPPMGYSIAICNSCENISLWKDERIVYPLKNGSIPPPSNDMPENVKNVYEEAREVFVLSPRSSAALLRLSLELLMPHLLDEPIDNLAKNIKTLTDIGLSEKIELSLESVRVLGNKSTHPGEINLNEDEDTSILLFHILNTIIEELITRKRFVDETFNKLPDIEKDKILKRIEERN